MTYRVYAQVPGSGHVRVSAKNFVKPDGKELASLVSSLEQQGRKPLVLPFRGKRQRSAK